MRDIHLYERKTSKISDDMACRRKLERSVCIYFVGLRRLAENEMSTI